MTPKLLFSNGSRKTQFKLQRIPNYRHISWWNVNHKIAQKHTAQVTLLKSWKAKSSQTVSAWEKVWMNVSQTKLIWLKLALFIIFICRKLHMHQSRAHVWSSYGLLHFQHIHSFFCHCCHDMAGILDSSLTFSHSIHPDLHLPLVSHWPHGDGQAHNTTGKTGLKPTKVSIHCLIPRFGDQMLLFFFMENQLNYFLSTP